MIGRGLLQAAERRGAVALMTALMMPLLIASLALACDLGVWYREVSRLQIASDAAAMAAARLLPYDDGSASGPQPQDFQTVAFNEALSATGGGHLIGDFPQKGASAVTAAVAADKSSATVVLSSDADLYFASYFVKSAPFTATSTAGRPKENACLIVLGFKNLLNLVFQTYVNIETNGQVTANLCVVLENPVVPLNVGLKVATGAGLSAFSVGAVGQAAFSPGSTVALAGELLQPTTPAQDPFSAVVANLTVPACGSALAKTVVLCPSSSLQTQYVVPRGASFASGTTYYVEGMDLVFDGNVIGTSQMTASNVTFVLTSSTALSILGITIPARNPGSLILQNKANVSIAAGTVPGVAVYQACAPLGVLTAPPASSIGAGSALTLAGAIYTPCGQLDVSGAIATAVTPGAASSLVVGAIDVAAQGRVSIGNTISGPPASVSQITLLQ